MILLGNTGTRLFIQGIMFWLQIISFFFFLAIEFVFRSFDWWGMSYQRSITWSMRPWEKNCLYFPTTSSFTEFLIMTRVTISFLCWCHLFLRSMYIFSSTFKLQVFYLFSVTDSEVTILFSLDINLFLWSAQ